MVKGFKMLSIPLLYKDRRLEGETPLRQCQLVQLHLLYVFDAICKEYNLTYFLGGGTLLGAMRHNGFIPWDDDLDVGMPRRDYERFLKIAEEVLPKDVALQTPKTNPNAPMFFSKLRDRYSFFYESAPYIATSDCIGIYLDIFPYDDLPDVSEKVNKWFLWFFSKGWWRVIAYQNRCREGFFQAWFYSVKSLFWKIVMMIGKVCFNTLLSFFPAERICLGFNNGFYALFPKDAVYPVSVKRFEDGEFPVPNNPDAFLTAQYGDWREIPPPEKRPRHAMIILSTQAPKASWSMKYKANA